VRSTVAGDDAALYNCLLLTVRDAAQLRGRKAIVVFSNGPDNASSVPPEDVEELAQSTGTIIYIISTRLAHDEPVSSAVFERMSKAPAAKRTLRRNWRDESTAFASIREDLAHLYTISYYPKTESESGLADDFGEAGGQGPGKVSGAHQRWISSAGTGADDGSGERWRGSGCRSALTE